MAKDGPFQTMESPWLEAAGQHIAVRRDRGTAASVIGVKVGYWVIPLVSGYVDHDPVNALTCGMHRQ